MRCVSRLSWLAEDLESSACFCVVVLSQGAGVVVPLAKILSLNLLSGTESKVNGRRVVGFVGFKYRSNIDCVDLGFFVVVVGFEVVIE